MAGHQAVDMPKVFGPLFRDPTLVSEDRWTLLIFHYTPHQEERTITSKNTSSLQFLEVREGRSKDGEPTWSSRPWRHTENGSLQGAKHPRVCTIYAYTCTSVQHTTLIYVIGKNPNPVLGKH